MSAHLNPLVFAEYFCARPWKACHGGCTGSISGAKHRKHPSPFHMESDDEIVRCLGQQRLPFTCMSNMSVPWRRDCPPVIAHSGCAEDYAADLRAGIRGACPHRCQLGQPSALSITCCQNPGRPCATRDICDHLRCHVSTNSAAVQLSQHSPSRALFTD